MKSSAARHFRKPETGVRFPAEALGVPSDSLGELSRSGSEQVGICPDHVPTEDVAKLLKKAVAATASARRAAYLAWHETHPLYAIWRGMKARCLSPKHHEFHRYGGRGIEIHRPWVDSYEQFEADVLGAIGSRADGMTIDRINNDGNYAPGNIRWLARKEQTQNKTHARGESQGLAVLTEASVYAIRRVAALNIFPKQQIANWFGIGRSTIGHVISRHTWRHVP